MQEPPVRAGVGVEVRIDEHLLPDRIVIDTGWCRDRSPADLGDAVMAGYRRAVRARVRRTWRELPRLVSTSVFDPGDRPDETRSATSDVVCASGVPAVVVRADHLGLTAVEVSADRLLREAGADEVAREILRCVDRLRPTEPRPRLAAELMASELAL
ncbi:hypothetical protein G4H71_11735 [Rhodococcus triatomae]|uniref:hypothetical protein n=1 Tax=Rhodococcus triatomae TaxID=300028 RepID=UPI0011145D39|nr:hypothetical protein [Rhodococcus triatomae]QNG20469.1 hypothetical protein G4H72_18645 [Rhodococcus triatomae]QNG23613.1 hypothetical protein G4H71_11735 [Rhodococcus triatomae]